MVVLLIYLVIVTNIPMPLSNCYLFTLARVSNILSHHKYRKKVKPELNYVVE